MSKDEAGKWFKEVLPRLADLLLRLPELLETHYDNAAGFCGMETGLRLLGSQQPGIVLLSQVTGCVCERERVRESVQMLVNIYLPFQFHTRNFHFFCNPNILPIS